MFIVDSFKKIFERFQTKAGFSIICHLYAKEMLQMNKQFQTKAGFSIICHERAESGAERAERFQTKAGFSIICHFDRSVR